MREFWRRKIRRRFSHFRSDADLQDEMRVHSEMDAEDRRAGGASETEARRFARLELGDTRVALEKVRDGEWITAFEGWYRDIVSGLRALRKSPLFSFTAVVTLALGIGANTAIFSFLYGLVLRSLPTQAPSQLMEVGFASTGEDSGVRATYVTYPMLRVLQKDLSSFSAISGWDGDGVLMEDKQGSLRTYATGLVTGNAFQVVPIRPYLGRLIAPFDDVRGAPSTGWPVVLSYGFWNDHYGKDPAILGKQIRVSGALATVIGIMPPDFKGVWPGTDIKMYLPMQFVNVLAKEDILNQPRSLYFFSAIGRLRPGTSIVKANAELTPLQKRLLAEFIPVKYQHIPFIEGFYPHVASVRSGLPTYITHTYAKPLYMMQGLVGLVLLLCCVNVGGLMMSKVYSRQREFAVRTALGAQSWRLVRQYLTESFVIAIVGSALGALLAWRGCDIMLHFFRDPMMGEAMDVHPDRSMLFIAGFLAVLTTLLFGALPAWRAGRADPGELLKTRTSLGGKRHIAGRTFVPIQIALSLVLVVLASLLSQSILKLRSEKTGFDLDHVTIQTSPLSLLRLGGEAKLNLYQRMVDRLDEMPGVRSAAVTYKTPMTGEEVMSRFQALGTGHDQSDVPMAFNEVGPGYFQTMKTRILSGREFAKNDRSLNVCILNRSAAAFLFPHQEALGQYVRTNDEHEFPVGTTCRVIGIAADAKFSDVRQGPPHTIYFPLSLPRIDDHIGNLVFLINSGSKLSAISAFRQTLTEFAPSVPLVIFVTLREQMDAALGSQELITLLSNFFGVVALLLSALGLYGLLSASVVQRTSEIGMRVALGADRQSVIRMILREALGMLGWGMLAGAIVLVLTTRFIAAMLHGVSSFDPLTLMGVAFVLTGVTFVAAVFPAFRAATVDPLEALRAE
jgi:predicted permease